MGFVKFLFTYDGYLKTRVKQAFSRCRIEDNRIYTIPNVKYNYRDYTDVFEKLLREGKYEYTVDYEDDRAKTRTTYIEISRIAMKYILRLKSIVEVLEKRGL